MKGSVSIIFTNFKSPTPSLELELLSLLQPRMDLPNEFRKRYERLQTGYQGEMKFFNLLQKGLDADCIQLYGLQLEMNQTEFQIDCLLIFQHKIYLFEIKNFSGDYIVQKDNWYIVSSKSEIRNPLHQLKRSELLLRDLLRQLGYDTDIESRLVFVNNTFLLYQAPYDQSTIFPNQLLRLLKKLNNERAPITNAQKNLANQLASRHIPRSAHERIPEYHFESLRKGIVCRTCQQFLTIFNRVGLVCNRCKQREDMGAAVMRNVAQFQTLFPNEKMTTAIIHEWCKIIESKKTIRRILQQNMIQVGSQSSVHFILK